eukprot:SRR837773.16673.p4 GENE.SRR837773.16673~~SRR837773.16673.p4  ORF type:complete len:148 (+),score=58.05 SRR837773.16673:63-446(+)
MAVDDFMQLLPPERSTRTVSAEASVLEAAASMANDGVDHLIVVLPGDSEAIGVVSSLDIVLCSKDRARPREPPSWSGPTVGEVLAQHLEPCACCRRAATLTAVAAQLVAAGRSSILVGSDAAPRDCW